MGLLNKLNPLSGGSQQNSSVRNYTVDALDVNDNVIDPTELTDVSDVSTVRFEFDNGSSVDVKRAFGSWECISCRDNCRHGHQAETLMNEWERFNTDSQ